MMFDKIKKFFDMGLYSRAVVLDFVKRGVICAEQFEMIVGRKLTDSTADMTE